jgi:hypothetical protein
MTGQNPQLADVESVTRARGLKFELVGKPLMMAMTLNGAGHSFSPPWRPVQRGSARSALAKQSRTVGSACEVRGNHRPGSRSGHGKSVDQWVRALQLRSPETGKFSVLGLSRGTVG